MKKILILAFSVVAICLSSCSDVKQLDEGYDASRYNNNGAPTITAIYNAQDTGYAEPLTSGELNQYIRIVGKNLANVKNLNINGLEVDIASRVYAESSYAIVRIPRYIPEEETGVMKYETDKGTIEIPFPVSIPAVEFNGLQNEFALAGSRVQLMGDFFDLYDFGDTTETSPVSIVITNDELGYNEVIKCDSCTETYTSVTIPKDCPDNSKITFSWKAMDGSTVTRVIPYRNTNALLFGNFEGDLGWWSDLPKTWVANSQLADAPANLGYNYMRLLGTFAAWEWDVTGWGCTWPFEFTNDEVEDYVFKFEVLTDPATPFPDYGDAGKYGARNGGYRMTLYGQSDRGQFDPVAEGITNTNGKWQTVTMPLRELFRDGLVPKLDEWVSFEFGPQPQKDWEIDHSFGQFRIEPKDFK